jgi:hypothetical protein
MVICSTKYVKNASQKNNVMKYFYVMVTAVESLPHNMRFGLFNNAANIPCYTASMIGHFYIIMAYSAVMAFSLIPTICTIRCHNASSEDALQVMI